MSDATMVWFTTKTNLTASVHEVLRKNQKIPINGTKTQVCLCFSSIRSSLGIIADEQG
jgi:hypothetical protein